MTRVIHVGFGFRPLRWGGLIAYAEDLMAAQAARGDAVAYFFAGRAYPRLARPRLRRFRRDGVAMFEVVNSPIVVGGGYGTADPLADLAQPEIEAMFARALDEHRAEVVHVHELLGLPSSLLAVARARGVRVVVTLHDYGMLCPTLKLYDHAEQVCERLAPGADCRVCCRDAPRSQANLVADSMKYEEDRFLLATRLHRVPRPQALVGAARTAMGAVLATRAPADAPAPEVAPVAPAAEYDERRRVNVERLSEADLVIGISERVSEIARERGVARVRTVHSSLAQMDVIPPRGGARRGAAALSSPWPAARRARRGRT